MKILNLVLLISLLTTGCLKTRADLRAEEDDATLQRQTASQQREQSMKPAPTTTASRFEEYDEQLRQLNGRVDVLENNLNQLNSSQSGDKQSIDRDKQALEQRLLAYEEAIKKLDSTVAVQADELAKLKSTASAPAAPAAKGRSSYDEGEDLFAAKKWKEAIVAYQKYRDGNPKGKMYPDSTYKIGVCFQELGMKDEAKAFYEEVSAKFPGAKEAKKASVRLKSFK